MAISAATMLLLHSVPSWADRKEATAAGVATATVVNPIAVRSLQALDFGVITASASTTGSVVVTPGSDDAQYSGGVHRVCGSGCQSPQAARFAVTGEAGRSYSVAAPVSLSATSDSAANPAASALRIEAIRLKTASRPDSGATGQINITGHDQFDLGGTLQVPAGAAPAHYQANLPVIMAYD